MILNSAINSPVSINYLFTSEWHSSKPFKQNNYSRVCVCRVQIQGKNPCACVHVHAPPPAASPGWTSLRRGAGRGCQLLLLLFNHGAQLLYAVPSQDCRKSPLQSFTEFLLHIHQFKLTSASAALQPQFHIRLTNAWNKALSDCLSSWD